MGWTIANALVVISLLPTPQFESVPWNAQKHAYTVLSRLSLTVNVAPLALAQEITIKEPTVDIHVK